MKLKQLLLESINEGKNEIPPAFSKSFKKMINQYKHGRVTAGRGMDDNFYTVRFQLPTEASYSQHFGKSGGVMASEIHKAKKQANDLAIKLLKLFNGLFELEDSDISISPKSV